LLLFSLVDSKIVLPTVTRHCGSFAKANFCIRWCRFKATTITSRQAKIQKDTHFRIMLILQQTPDLTRRELADKLGMSVGGLNYCLNALINKGLVKMPNSPISKNKFKYVYFLTPMGIAQKVALTSRFLSRKMEEHEALKQEVDATGQ
jgi:EPS-associated MarR family transcriptional regulator